MKSARLVLGLTVSLMALHAVHAHAGQPEFTVEDFEQAGSQIKAEGAGAAVVNVANANQAGSALEISFSDANEASVAISLASPIDATTMGEANIAFDVVNSGSISVPFSVTLHDASGGYRRYMAVIGAGERRTMYAVVNGYEASVETGLREIPPAWSGDDRKLLLRNYSQFDASAIASIAFQTEANPAARTILVDNIRLRANPPADPFFLTDLVDRYGQSAKLDYPGKINSDAELRQAAQRELASLAISNGAPDRSRFGGWSAGPKLAATGYFRTEKVDGKWWMVDPDGYLFFSSGIANIRMANLGTMTGYDFNDPAVRIMDPERLTPEDSIDIIPVAENYRNSRFLSSPLRRQMFQWLPTYDAPLGDHYGYRRSAHRGAMEHGEIFSFYKANLERRYGDDYMAKWREVTIDRMRDWGMTSFGNWVDASYYQNNRIPYFANGWIIGNFKTVSSGADYWSPLPDVYDPEFKRRARLTIEQIAREVQGSPWCVGVFVDNEKGWGRTDTIESTYGLVLDALSKDAADSPAKAHFTGMMKKAYGGDVGKLNAAWGTSYTGWGDFELKARPADLNAAQGDLSAMMKDFGETYFRTVRAELKRVMPNHMYMGVRMAEWGMPREIIDAAVEQSDVLSFNNYREMMHPEKWAFLNDLDRPTIIGEFHIGATSDTGLYHPGLIYATDQKDRARMYEVYMNSVIDNPMMVGAHWFQYIDDNVTGRAYDGENYNVGWVSNTDIPYDDMVAAARRVNYGLYQRRYGEAGQ